MIGNWNLDKETSTFELETQRIIDDVIAKMFGAEEKAYTELAIQALREKGYTVTKNE